jgi:hypothetical protein
VAIVIGLLVLVLLIVGAVLYIRRNKTQEQLPLPAYAAVYHGNPVFVVGAGVGAGTDASADADNADAAVNAENADYMEAVPGQEILYDNKLVPGARDHVPPGIKMLQQRGQPLVDEDYVDVEEEERQRQASGHAAEYSTPAADAVYVPGAGAGAGSVGSGSGAGGVGIDVEYAAASTSLAMHQMHGGAGGQASHHCRYTKAGVSGSVCHAKAVRGQGYCPRHTCERTGCSNVKTSQAKVCDQCGQGGRSAGAGGRGRGGGGGRGGRGGVERSGKHKASVYAGFEEDESEL